MSDVIGQIIAHYRVEELIGAGGMGTVYRARDLKLERTVALKLMHSQIAIQREFRERLKTEAQIAASLDHPSIVKIFDFGETPDGVLYIAMEYIADGSLRDHLQRARKRESLLELPLVLQIGTQIADALAHAQARRVIHRDVKPGNIILKRLARPEETGFAPFRAVLTDFGLVQVIHSQRLTDTGVTMGTPVYMSPEQCEGLPLDGRSDLYSLGVVLYEMLTGRPPFNFGSLAEAVATHVRGLEPPTVREVRSNVPPLIDALLARALAKEPEDRFASADEMAAALRTAYFSIAESPTRVWRAGEETLLVNPPPGYMLTVRTRGREEIDRYPLDRPFYSVGRSADNDLILGDDSVSRYHLRLEHTADGWNVRPLPGVNGTEFDGRLLAPDERVAWRPDETVRIGPYEFRLELQPVESRSSAGTPLEVKPTEVLPEHEEQRAQDEKFALFLDRDEVVVEPGRSAVLHVEVINRTPIDDRVRLQLLDIPPEWVTLPRGFIPIAAGERAEVTVQFHPPRNALTSAGRRGFRLQLSAQRNREAHTALDGTLQIGAFESFTADLVPEEVQVPGSVAITLKNSGNATSDFSVIARDADDRLKFTGERGRVRLDPQQATEITLELDWKQSQLLSFGAESVPFEILVRAARGGSQVLNGRARSATGFMSIFVYVGCAVFAGLCALVAFSLLPALLGGEEPIAIVPQTETPAIVETVAATLLPEALTATSVVATADAAPTPSSPLDDDDGDGLSNAQEALLGTDPNVVDSDGDGLTDGDELYRWSTEPTQRDSDRDGLSDGDELSRYGTNPRLTDTDGDGVGDGDEIARGTDPLVAPISTTATPEGTATLLPSLTPEPSPTGAEATATLLPSLTPSPSPSSSPSPTTAATVAPSPTGTTAPSATPTSAPSPTATSAPTAAPTATPTTAPTAAVTPSPAATVTPPQLSCAATPPAIDGQRLLTEPWQDLVALESEQDVDRIVDVFFVKDASQVYFAFVVTTDDLLDGDEVRLYLDVNNSGGDPDFSDRLFTIARDGTFSVQAGSGTSGDGDGWDPTYTGTDWEAAISETAFGWSAEMRFAVAAETPALGNPFKLVLEVFFADSGETVTWPANAPAELSDNWQAIDNSAVCPAP